MEWRSRAVLAALMSLGFSLFAQEVLSSAPTPVVCDPDSPSPSSPVEVMSDLGGVNFTKYLTHVLVQVRKEWYSVIPDQARPPEKRKGCSVIEFSILRDGKVEDVKFISASGDEQLNHAALRGITKSAPFPALPSAYARPSVVVRFHFYYNPSWGLTENPPAGATHANTSITASVGTLKAETIPPRALYSPFPSYTERAIQANKQGTVLISLVVNQKGGVSHLQVVEGIDHDLDGEARKIIKTWKFEPETINGEATEVPLIVKVTFTLK
jgi:TonB family protein